MKPNTELNDPSIAILEPASSGSTAACVSKPWPLEDASCDVLLKALEFGRFRGVVSLYVGTPAGTTVEAIVNLVRILIERDILIVAYGPALQSLQGTGVLGDAAFEYSSEGLAELCDYVDISPVSALADWDAQSSSEQFFDLIAERSSVLREQLPFTAITMSEDAAELMQERYSVVFQMKTTADLAADQLDDYIHQKRLSLDWSDRYHCSIETYS
jgi:hypothetical protein